MKKLLALVILSTSVSAFAAKADLSCVADDFSPLAVKFYKKTDGIKVVGYINRKEQKAIKASGTLTSEAIDLKIGSEGGSVSGNGFGGIYGVLTVTIPEYNIHAVRMTCFSETLDQ